MPDIEDMALTITPKKISFWLALIALATFSYTGISVWNDRGYAVDTLQKNDALISLTVEKLNANVEKLDEAVRDLTLQMARSAK